MFDDLRNDAASKPFYDEEEAQYQPAASSSYSSKKPGRFLGMTPAQRFILAFLMMMAVCVIGALALFVTGKFVL